LLRAYGARNDEMKPLIKHTGVIATLNRANVDTDQIIAKQFLKSIKRTGFGPQLFYDWRYNADGKPNPDFELNHPQYKGASILVAQNNFGCGSSREHAVWAIAQDGYQVLIAPKRVQDGQEIPGFADIFKNNCSKNAILTIELSQKEVDQIFKAVTANRGVKATADLKGQTLVIHAPNPLEFKFDILQSTKERLMQGLDDIGITLGRESDITRFEKSHNPQIA
jgi:3-isopropylmalate/(R)-2-methylmalate dehydratase small subunit